MTWLWTKIRGFKTLGFNFLVFLAMVAAWGSSYDWSQLNTKNAALIGMIFSFSNMMLRLLTSTPPMTGKD